MCMLIAGDCPRRRRSCLGDRRYMLAHGEVSSAARAEQETVGSLSRGLVDESAFPHAQDKSGVRQVHRGTRLPQISTRQCTRLVSSAPLRNALSNLCSLV